MKLKTIPYDAYEPRSKYVARAVSFFTSSGRPGINLERAMRREVDELDGRNDPFFEKSGVKIRYRIAVCSLIIAKHVDRTYVL